MSLHNQWEVFVCNSEPGFYEDGKFGCRIEDIVRIVRADVPYNFKKLNYLTFETVSLVPIQIKMLLPEMLSEREVSADAGVGTGSCKTTYTFSSYLSFRVSISCVLCFDLFLYSKTPLSVFSHILPSILPSFLSCCSHLGLLSGIFLLVSYSQPFLGFCLYSFLKHTCTLVFCNFVVSYFVFQHVYFKILSPLVFL